MSTTTTTASKTGPRSLWPSTLQSILFPAPRLVNPDSESETISHHALTDNNPRRHRHLPGMVWKRTLGQSLHSDLYEEENAGSLTIRERRRFSRLESLGLSGVVLYEIPQTSQRDGLSLKTVFGDRADPEFKGMAIDELLDRVGARVIYFPSYACTSFVTGLAVSAFFQQQPRIRPVPAFDGFSVDARAFLDSSFTIGPSFPLDIDGPFLAQIPLICVAPTSSPVFEVMPQLSSSIQEQLPAMTLAPSHDELVRPSFCDMSFLESGSLVDLGTHNLGDTLSDAPFNDGLKTKRFSVCDAIETNTKSLTLTHSETLSRVLADYVHMFSGEMTREFDTSVSTTAGPRTPPTNSPVLDDYFSSDLNVLSTPSLDCILEQADSARRPKLLTLDVPDVDDPAQPYLPEPLTPVTNTRRGLDSSPTPTKVHPSLFKAKRRLALPWIPLGKENIAPTVRKFR